MKISKLKALFLAVSPYQESNARQENGSCFIQKDSAIAKLFRWRKIDVIQSVVMAKENFNTVRNLLTRSF